MQGGVLAVLGAIVLVVLWLGIQASIAKDRQTHREETGVDVPSRQALARIRANARKKGISIDAAYDEWLANKQRRKPKA